MGNPLGPKYIPYSYMDPLGYTARTMLSGMPRQANVSGGLPLNEGFRI